MVSTRGNPLSETGRRSTLPTRESRRNTRGALQEPEDELFWDSDDQPSRVRRRAGVSVSFKGATSPRSTTSRSPGSAKEDPVMKVNDESPPQQLPCLSIESSEESEKAALRKLRTRTLAVLLSRSLADKKLKGWARKRPSCFSCDEAPRPQPSRDNSRGRPAHRRQDEVAAVEADTDTDDEIFSRTQSRRTRGKRNKDSKNSLKKEFVMNGDDLGDHDHLEEEEEDEGPRRSSRKKKFSAFDQSWLVGNKKLRGYPSIVPSSEPENDEPRPSRKMRKYIDTEVEPRRRRVRRYEEADDQDFRSLAPKTHRATRRRRGPPRRYREDPDNSEDEDGRRLRARCGNQVKVEDDEDNQEEMDTDGEALERSEQHMKRFKEAEERCIEDREEGNEGDDDDDDEELPQKRRTTRSSLVAAGEKIDDTEEEEEEESPVIRRRGPKRKRDTPIAGNLSLKDSFVDMYSRVKRQRRPVKRFMYEDEVSERRARKHNSSS
ncbi:hypothetical protein OTU49_005707, partial [Cherax quadricarinatus]